MKESDATPLEPSAGDGARVVRLCDIPLPLPPSWVAPLSEVRSDPRTLQLILSSTPPPAAPVGRVELENWVRSRRDRPGEVFQAITVGAVPVGFVLAVPGGENLAGAIEVGLALAPGSRGQGVGRSALDLLVARLPAGAALVARVRADNGPAGALFRAAGFTRSGETTAVTPQDTGPVAVEILTRP